MISVTTSATTNTTTSRRSSWCYHLFMIVATGLLLGACQEKSPADEPGKPSAKKDAPAAIVVPERDRTGMDTSSRPGYYPPANTPTTGDPNVRPDTTDGTLKVLGSGAATGTWVFYDATASLDELTRAGVTTSALQIPNPKPQIPK